MKLYLLLCALLFSTTWAQSGSRRRGCSSCGSSSCPDIDNLPVGNSHCPEGGVSIHCPHKPPKYVCNGPQIPPADCLIYVRRNALSAHADGSFFHPYAHLIDAVNDARERDLDDYPCYIDVGPGVFLVGGELSIPANVSIGGQDAFATFISTPSITLQRVGQQAWTTAGASGGLFDLALIPWELGGTTIDLDFVAAGCSSGCTFGLENVVFLPVSVLGTQPATYVSLNVIGNSTLSQVAFDGVEGTLLNATITGANFVVTDGALILRSPLVVRNAIGGAGTIFYASGGSAFSIVHATPSNPHPMLQVDARASTSPSNHVTVDLVSYTLYHAGHSASIELLGNNSLVRTSGTPRGGFKYTSGATPAQVFNLNNQGVYDYYSKTTANPNGNVLGNIGDRFTSGVGGINHTLWIKELGPPGNTGWKAVVTA